MNTDNDQSILEHHHCASTFRILRQDENNILKTLSPDEYRSARKLIISSILSTDMTCHFNLGEKFAALLERDIGSRVGSITHPHAIAIDVSPNR